MIEPAESEIIGKKVEYQLFLQDYKSLPNLGWAGVLTLMSFVLWPIILINDFWTLITSDGRVTICTWDKMFPCTWYLRIREFGAYILASFQWDITFRVNFCVWLLLIVWVCWLIRCGMNKAFNTDRMIKKTGRLALTEQGVLFTWPDCGAYMKWPLIYYWCETVRHILVYRSSRFVYLIPKRVEKDGFPLARCRELLLEKVGKPKQRPKIKKEQEK